jgi:hypothetical protein
MSAFFKLVAAGPMFFVSAWLLMIFAGIVGADVGIRPFGYVTSMVVTIGLWLVLAPAIGAASRGAAGGDKKDCAANALAPETEGPPGPARAITPSPRSRGA